MTKQLAAVTPVQYAQQLIEYSKTHKLFATKCAPFTKNAKFYVAITQKPKKSQLDDLSFPCEFSEEIFQTKIKRTLKEALSENQKIPKTIIPKIKTAFDQIGTIAILEIDSEIRDYEKIIAQTLLDINSAIKTVLRKDGAHDGEYRVQALKILAGEKTTKTTTIENGVSMTLDVAKTYFSPRLANERLRIAKQVQKDENILIMFSGISPQAFIIENEIKKQIAAQIKKESTQKQTSTQTKKPTSNQTNYNLKILCVEINPDANADANYNIQKLKLKHTTAICADMKDYAKVLIDENKKFDRIIMNLPKTAYEFLDEAMKLITRGGTIHYYDFLKDTEFDIATDRLKKAAQKYNKNITIQGIHTVGCQGIKTYRICVDAKII
jgi:tRNA (guanine37-N1)-methyltransferase